MASNIVTTIGNQAHKALSRLNYVNPLIWGGIPGVIFAVVTLAVVIYIRPSLSGSKMVNECHPESSCNGQHNCGKSRRVCRQRQVSNKLNILWYILAPILIGLVSGSIGYKVGFMINNPKTGTLIGMAGLVRGALR